jgi:hypothetical protein
MIAEKDRAIVLAAREHFLRDGFAGADRELRRSPREDYQGRGAGSWRPAGNTFATCSWRSNWLSTAS